MTAPIGMLRLQDFGDGAGDPPPPGPGDKKRWLEAQIVREAVSGSARGTAGRLDQHAVLTALSAALDAEEGKTNRADNERPTKEGE